MWIDLHSLCTGCLTDWTHQQVQFWSVPTLTSPTSRLVGLLCCPVFVPAADGFRGETAAF